MNPICRHCTKSKVNRPRGLCWSCYYTPGVKEQYGMGCRHGLGIGVSGLVIGGQAFGFVVGSLVAGRPYDRGGGHRLLLGAGALERLHAAQHLDRLVGAELHGLGGLVLEHADLGHPFCTLGGFVAPIPRIRPCAHGLQPSACGLDAHLHVHQLVTDHLVVHQRSAKGLALLRPSQRLVVTTFGKAQRHGGHGKSLAVEVGQDDLEARPLLAQQIGGRHAAAARARRNTR